MSSNTNEKQEPIFSSGAEALLAVKLFQLGNPKSSAQVQEEAVVTIFALMIVRSGDEAFKDKMVAMNAIETIVKATKRDSASVRLIHRAAGIFVELVEDNKSRSTSFVDRGGVDCIMKIMESRKTNSFLMISCVAVFIMLLHVVSDEQRVLIAARVFEKAFTVMELHYKGAHLYALSCNVLGLCSGPGVTIRFELWHRAVQSTFDGIVLLNLHEDAQTIGRHLLVHLIGQEAAIRMIDRAEMRHCQDAVYCCAA